MREHQPAIAGGTPVRDTLLPYGRQQVTEEDIAAVVEVLRSDWLTTGPKIGEFEEAVAAFVGAAHAVAFSSGTAALHAAASAAGISSGDEAITTPLTFAATANCVLYRGGTPVFADVEAESMTIDPAEIERRITPRTRCLLPVDYTGHPAEYDAILRIAREHGLIVIEDAAHALGASYRGTPVGTLSDMAMFSFHPVKHIATGEGGIITTNDRRLADIMRRFRSHGIDSDARARQEQGAWYYEMKELGYNYRIPDINCALGLSQLRRMDENLTRRRDIARRYGEQLSKLPGITLPVERGGCRSAWHLYVVRIREQELRATREDVFKALRAENIGVNVHYIPVHLHPYYREHFGTGDGMFPVAEGIYRAAISLPMFHAMAGHDEDDVIEAMTKILTWYAR
jgi:perosamine synthetase